MIRKKFLVAMLGAQNGSDWNDIGEFCHGFTTLTLAVQQLCGQPWLPSQEFLQTKLNGIIELTPLILVSLCIYYLERNIMLCSLLVLFLLIGVHHICTYVAKLPCIITVPVETGQPAPTISVACSKSPSSSQKRYRSVDEGHVTGEGGGGGSGSGGGSKRRKTLYHSSRAHCLPCILWEQSGSDSNLQHLHPIKDSRHVGADGAALSYYACNEGNTFELAWDDCVCKPCYTDFQRNKENKGIPRWAKVRDQFYSARPTRHCIYCCEENGCNCEGIQQWGPEQWTGEDTTMIAWKKFLTLTGKVVQIPDHANHICRVHYRGVLKLKQSRSCSVCSSHDSSTWLLVCDLVPNPQLVETTFRLEPGSVGFFDWVCNQCALCYKGDAQLENTLMKDRESIDPFTAEKSKLLLDTLNLIESEGVVFTKDVMTRYKLVLSENSVPKTHHNRYCNTLIKYLTTLSSRRRYQTFTPPNNHNVSGKAIYDETKFTTHSLHYIFKQREHWNNSVTFEHLQNMIRKQIDCFPTSKEFDFTGLISKESGQIELDAYFDPELFEIIDSITQSKASTKHGISVAYKHLRKVRIQNIIGMLCLTMNPNCCFLQTLNGLLCYAYGLRDKGFKALNALGCCCSVDHIRNHGTFWANQKNCIDQLNGLKPWRLTIDNLNFYMKYAKNLPESATGANKMLNLLTAQVSHPSSVPVTPLTLKGMVFKSMATSVQPHIKPLERSSVDIDNFMVKSGGHESYYYQHFLGVCYVVTLRGLSLPPTEHKCTFLKAIQSMMPHWTPQSKDNVVYATIEEASSGSLTDVQAYLSKVKEDLKISQSGSPMKIPVAGDQQTYALMKKLQKEHPDHYSWMVVLHGDWHMLQLLAEVLRDILWDGGLKQICSKCGYKKMPTQWQEIHLFLLALYQALLHKALLVFNQKQDAGMRDYKTFWSWLSEVGSDNNKDDISKFWARILPFLSGYVGYFVAIRSGNWVMRNCTIPVLTPLFFSYNHYKYEELATQAVIDSLTLPSDILSNFLRGGWTVSSKGKPHHNLALDEAHESIINLRLKTITSRPSHFRTVELANFMSYLDGVVRGVEGNMYAHREQEPVQYRKRYACQRAARIEGELQEVDLYAVSKEERQLKNILSASTSTLDSKSTEDLLSIEKVGIKRMRTYLSDSLLAPPEIDKKKKGKKRPRKLATFSCRPSSTREGKARERELTTIAKNAMELLKANGITAQTSPYPLALSDLEGNLRASGKSKFLASLTKCLDFERAISSTYPSTQCIIIDAMYYIHMPPPLSTNTFLEYFEHLWGITVAKYGMQNENTKVYLVFDHQDYLPPPRSIVHTTRGKGKQQDLPDPLIRNDSPIPHGNSYSSLLANSKTFRKSILHYLTSNLVKKALATTKHYNFTVVIDSPSVSSVVVIQGGQSSERAPNEHGEADYAIWHHCLHESSTSILIVSSDTDTWVYGLGLCELGHLRGKTVAVRRGNVDSYIHISRGTSILSGHESLEHFHSPVLSLVALYILTGCDYVSAFYRCTKTKFLASTYQGQFLCMSRRSLSTDD